jgi:hypothetical protein
MRGACAYTEGVPSVFDYAAALLALRDMDLTGREGQLLADCCLSRRAENPKQTHRREQTSANKRGGVIFSALCFTRSPCVLLDWSCSLLHSGSCSAGTLVTATESLYSNSSTSFMLEQARSRSSDMLRHTMMPRTFWSSSARSRRTQFI